MADASLAGQVALVTGASTGIGRQLAHALADRGAAVAGLARGAERLTAAVDEIAGATGRPVLAVAADVTDAAAVDAAVARVVEQLGPVDLLVNNAGLVDAAEVPVWAADREQWWAVVASHIRGPQLLIGAVVPAMVRRGRGRVVNLASGMGARAVPEYSAYSVGKTGLIRLTEALAASLLGTGVHAFNVAPGLVRTEMTDSMPKWEGHTAWTPPERVVELVCAIAAGELDDWSGRFLRAGADTPDTVGRVVLEEGARQLRLRPHGPDDPVA
ncbi:SDR family NAD(P)-dependent oxidoreductase [Geodermatophilus chilensis]|uniref:SDR family NAD(P)-dependent oxidoreductase n=1 Tax=Geodermatophilus chilensis TaxID=2035835 RepID=UPI000C258DFB|nr:SDR family oxidoreductase [Geodermatophilus chilensis]